MENTINNGKKILFRVVLYLILLTLFAVFYAKNAFTMYMSGSTSFGQRQENIEENEPPVLILCLSPLLLKSNSRMSSRILCLPNLISKQHSLLLFQKRKFLQNPFS